MFETDNEPLKQTASSPVDSSENPDISQPHHPPNPARPTSMLFPALIFCPSRLDSLCCQTAFTLAHVHLRVFSPGAPSAPPCYLLKSFQALIKLHTSQTFPMTNLSVHPRPVNPNGLALCPRGGAHQNPDLPNVGAIISTQSGVRSGPS